jgi:hypothetical protein
MVAEISVDVEQKLGQGLRRTYLGIDPSSSAIPISPRRTHAMAHSYEQRGEGGDASDTPMPGLPLARRLCIGAWCQPVGNELLVDIRIGRRATVPSLRF